MRITLLLTIVVLSASVAAAEEAASPLPVVWSISDGLQAPESAYVDPDSGLLFLSQIGGGGGAAKDGDGWISKLTPEGKMLKNKWVTGLNAPKGLRSHGGVLWVSDIDRLVAIDIAKGKITKTIEVPGAKFLNDVAAGPDGTIYVSDMRASRVHQYRDGKLSVLAEGEKLEHPNGLLVHAGKLILGAWGTSEQKGRLLSLDLKTGKVTPITKKPVGNLDGVEVDGHGGYLVSDWLAGAVFHITGNGKVRQLADFPQGSADHAYLAKKHLLILPRMKENKLTAFDLSKVVK